MSKPAANRDRLSRITVPYGIAFSIQDLMRAAAWGRARGLLMEVALDQLRGGAEFEEMLIFCARSRQPQGQLWQLHVWRTEARVLAQAADGPVMGFATLAEALEAQLPPKRRWLFGFF